MAKIDVSTIEGFEGMSAEQKVEALMKIEVPEKVDMSGFIAKSQFDKTASELADAKKALKSKMTEDEAAAAEREAKWADMEAKVAQLEKEKLESTYKASYLALGYEEELATDTAKAMAAGDMAKVFANQKKATEAAEQKFRAEAMKNTPTPEGNGGGKPNANEVDAKNLGKARAESRKDSDDILKHYM